MFDCIQFVPGDSTHSGFEYRPGAGLEARFGFFYADGAVSCVQVFTDAGEKLHKLRQPVHVKNPV